MTYINLFAGGGIERVSGRCVPNGVRVAAATLRAALGELNTPFFTIKNHICTTL